VEGGAAATRGALWALAPRLIGAVETQRNAALDLPVEDRPRAWKPILITRCSRSETGTRLRQLRPTGPAEVEPSLGRGVPGARRLIH